MSALTLTNLSKTFAGGARAVDGVSLDIHDGEFLVLVGPSGCGKSTTLRMIAGLEDITEGEIRIGERVVNHVSPKDRNISMVFQNYALYPHMSVRKNMSFGLELRYGGGIVQRSLRRLLRARLAATLNAKRAGIRPRVEETAAMLQITHLLDRMPGQLSGGERQRVALGRAIVREPEVFLFDEPLSNLDAKLRVEMRRELKQLHARLGTTMIYVTHDQVEAMTLGDRVAVMRNGQIQQVGPPLQLYDRPANRFVAAFMGSPSMNLLDGELVEQQGELTLQLAGLKIPFPASWRQKQLELAEPRATVGIRPEDIVLSNDATQPSFNSVAIPAEVVMIESLGDSSLVTVRLLGECHRPSEAGSTEVIVRVNREECLETGARKFVIMTDSRMHLFAGEECRRIDFDGE